MQMIESAEKSLDTARELLAQAMGTTASARGNSSVVSERLSGLSVSEGGRVVEGVFDGQNMTGPEGKIYPVPANYASKSKLCVGDVLKLTISDDGTFIYKQIQPVERKKVMGILSKNDKGEYSVEVDGKSYRVLLASLTYFKAEPGDTVTIVIPKDEDVAWAAVENVIKHDFEPTDTELPGADDAHLMPKRATSLDLDEEL